MPCSNNKLFQTGALCSFVDKIYQGDCTFETLIKKGNLGIGTFDDVHGEFIGFDGNFYRIIEDGIARVVELKHKTPFAWVVDFEETHQFTLKNIENFTHFSQEFDKNIPSANFIYAYRFICPLQKIKCRTEACQPKPYKPLIETLPGVQVNFEYTNIEGVAVGFRFPHYLAALNVPGHHIHFVEPTKMRGGHVFDLAFKSAVVSVCCIKNFELALIDSPAFQALNINTEDLAGATHSIEKQR